MYLLTDYVYVREYYSAVFKTGTLQRKLSLFFPMSVRIQGLGHLDHMTTKTKIKSGKFKSFDNTTL